MTIQKPPGRSTISQPKTKDNLAIAAARLKRHVPQAWQEFETAMQALYVETVQRCVLSPSNEIFSNQGRAQLMTELCETFRTCIATADDIEAKLKERR